MTKRTRFQLAPEQQKRIKELFHKTRDTREKERYQAVLLRNKGYKISEIAEILERCASVINLWCKNYRAKEVESLKSKPQVGNHRKLTKQQRADLKREINNYRPCELGYEGRFWSVNILRTHIKKRFNIVYKTNWSYQQIFAESGFSFHKPIKKDRRQDPEKVAAFEEDIKKRFRSIKEKTGSYWRKTKHG